MTTVGTALLFPGAFVGDHEAISFQFVRFSFDFSDQGGQRRGEKLFFFFKENGSWLTRGVKSRRLKRQSVCLCSVVSLA